ncbi:MAG: FtsQ-type POTRA domain-containing protein [Actinobacteria bacterium]|nr:FtsQ-type POTRA domain-containing protein [Actinomycetota bacterium]
MTTGTLVRPSSPRAAASGRIDPRMQQRREQVRADDVRRRRRRFGAFALVSVLVAGAVGLTRSPLLDVDHVLTVGATRTGRDAVLAAARIDIGEPMVSIDLGAAETRIERLPWVADATVTRDWPGTVRIAVIERVRVATTDGPSPLLVDREGRILGSAVDTDGLPSIGPRPDGAAPGDLVPPAMRSRVRAVEAMPSALAAQVESVTSGAEGIELVLDDGIVVVVGDADRLRAKFEVVATRLAQDDRSTIATINVTVPDAAALTRVPDGGA